MGASEQPHIETTLATLRLAVQTALNIRETARRLGDDRLVAREDADIATLRQRIASLEHLAAQIAARRGEIPPADR